MHERKMMRLKCGITIFLPPSITFECVVNANLMKLYIIHIASFKDTEKRQVQAER